jgi:proline dehydrogenase
LIEIAGALAAHHGRDADSYEYQMLYGIRPDEQKRIADRGNQMRVYIPYGEEWYGYLMRRMAERPANTMFFLRGLATRG